MTALNNSMMEKKKALEERCAAVLIYMEWNYLFLYFKTQEEERTKSPCEADGGGNWPCWSSDHRGEGGDGSSE